MHTEESFDASVRVTYAQVGLSNKLINVSTLSDERSWICCAHLFTNRQEPIIAAVSLNSEVFNFLTIMVQKPSLYVLAVNHKHDEIVKMMEANDTSGIDWQDRYGNTALHVLCKELQLHMRAISSIIEKRPQLIARANHANWTPLHLDAERRLSLTTPMGAYSDILISMIRACPDAVSIPKTTGCTPESPFDIACTANADFVVLKEMLLVDPSLSLPLRRPNTVKTRLDHLWRQGASQSMNLIALTAFHGQVTQSESSLLHSVCYQRVPIQYFELTLKNHYCQASQRDHNGNLPLHYACQNVPQGAQPYTQRILKCLLGAYPHAASTMNSEGRLPLHCLLDEQLTWHNGGILEVVSANSSALRTVDPKTNLFPFQMAATNANRSWGHFSTLLEILLAAPEMLDLRNYTV